MSDIINIQNSAKDFQSSPESGEYSKVILHIDDETYVEAGTDTGRTLEANCPFATQAIANNLLEKLKGFRYQPYSADGALFDPAAELGDGIKISDILGGLYSQEINFGSLCSSVIEAPQDGDIEHEYPYESKQNRDIDRRISKRVTQDQAESLISQEMDKITLSVSGDGGTTTFEIKKDNATLTSETVDLKVKSVNIEGELSADKITSGELNANNVKVVSSGDVGSGYGDCLTELSDQSVKGTHDSTQTTLWSIESSVSSDGTNTFASGSLKIYALGTNIDSQTPAIIVGGKNGGCEITLHDPYDGYNGYISLVFHPDIGLRFIMNDGSENVFSVDENGTVRCKRLIVNNHEIT